MLGVPVCGELSVAVLVSEAATVAELERDAVAEAELELVVELEMVADEETEEVAVVRGLLGLRFAFSIICYLILSFLFFKVSSRAFPPSPAL